MARLRFGPFLLDTTECLLFREGAEVEVQPKVFEVLRFFAERPGRLVTRDELLKGVWHGVFVSDQALTQMLRKARLALGDDPDAPRYLATVPRRGYRFVAAVEAPDAEPYAAPGDAPRAEAPRAPEGLVGREPDVESLLGLLAAGTRIVTLVGPPGVGKSRLAQAVVARAGREARVVPLAGVGGEDAAACLAAAAEGPEELLLLDDADRALDAVAATAARLGEGRRTLVVTSREALRMEGEQVWPVRPLAAEGPGEALFVARARAVLPDFAPDSEQRAAIRALVAELDGLPLAIELAAARVRTLPPQALLARLDARLDWLASARRDQPPRHASLAAALDEAWQTLSPAERAALTQLAALPGPFSVEDAEGAVDLSAHPDAPPVFVVLDALFGRSLVVRAGAGPGAPYRLLHAVRAFARARGT